MSCGDLFHFNTINLDPLTETYPPGFYQQARERGEEGR